MDLVSVAEFAPAAGAVWREGDAWLGGGSWLFSRPQPGLRRLLDLHAFGWEPLRETPEGLTIAATCTFAQLDRWRPASRERDDAAALARQCCHALLGSFKVHNVATVGGNICRALPAGPMISLTAALDGVATLRAPDGAIRRLPVAELVTGDGQTALQTGELLTLVTIPAAALAARSAFRQLSLSPAGRSAVLVIGRRDPGGSAETVVTVTAATPRPVQLRFPAAPGPGELLAMLGTAVPEYLDDVHGSGHWRKAMTRRLAGEVVAELAA